MTLADIFSRRRRPLDAGRDGPSPIGDDLSGNDAVRRRQRLLLGGAAGVGLLASCFWIFGGDSKHATDPDAPQEVHVSTSDLVNRNLSEQEWMALSENRFQSTENQLRAATGDSARVEQLAQQIEALRTQNQSMAADGQRVVSAYQQENENLRRQINDRPAAAAAPAPGATALYGPAAPPLYQRPDGATTSGAAATAAARPSEVRLVSFTPAAGTASPVERGTTVYADSVNYLPPNSFASAKVIVGVDASAGVNSQTDPLPVVLRITGPARSVFQDGRLLTTRIEGCLVNGAARGDLSSEKVYVKLQKMTCPQPGGRVAVSEVKGFIAFGGKTGVRGRVISREGSLVTQAFIAGLAGGFGRGFSANTQSLLSGSNVTVNGQRQQLGLGEIAQAGLGEGVAQSADTVSHYLIERAEQYQPVIEMPTGVDVEIVFLEGVYVRN